MPAAVTVKEWSRLMAQANSPANGEHPWICEVRRDGGGRRYEVLSQQEYDQFSKQHSWWNSSCCKLSLSKILDISQNCFFTIGDWLGQEHKHSITFEGETYSAFSRAVGEERASHFKGKTFNSYSKNPRISANTIMFTFFNLQNLFSTDIENKFRFELENVKDAINTLAPMALKLGKMSQRALLKRSAEKTKSLWGKIKWYLWLWLFDKRGQVNEIKKSVPVLKEVFKSAREGIQHRTNMNAEYFEKEIGVENPQEYDFSIPRQVKQLWLKKYAPDRYQGKVSDHADRLRKRIVTLVKLWEKLLDIEKENIVA